MSQLVYLPSFLSLFLSIREFCLHSRMYTGFLLGYPCIYAGFLHIVMYALSFAFVVKIKCWWVSYDDCWVSLDASRVCIHLCFWPETFFISIFFRNVLVIAFSIFCFGISALGLFYLGALLGCFMIVLADSGGGRVIILLHCLILIQKIQKICFLHHDAFLHFGFCMVLALGFLGIILVIFSYRNDCIFHLKENFAFHVVAYPIFHLTHCICIDC